MNKSYKKLFNDTIVFAIGNFGSKILTFLLVPLYTSLLTTEQYGTADLITTTVSLLCPVLTLTIYEAILRFVLDKKYNSSVVFNSALLLTIVGTLTLVLFSPLVFSINWYLSDYWFFLLLIYISTAFQMCFSFYLKGVGKTKLFAVQGIIYTICYLISNIVFLVFLKAGIEGYLFSVVIGYTASNIFMFLCGSIYKIINPKKIDLSVLKEMLLYSIPLAPTTVLWWINASADKYMLLWFIGAGANGLYSVANKIPTIFSTFSSLFSQAWRISAISSYDNDKERAHFYSKVYNYYFVFSLYICIFLASFSEFFAGLLFKNDYYSAWILIPMLVFASLIEGLSGVLASIYAAAKKTKLLMISTLVGALFNIVLNYFLIKYLGVIGAPIATSLSFVLIWAIRIIVLKKIMTLRINHFKDCLSLLLTFVVFVLFSYSFYPKYLYILVLLVFITIINFGSLRSLSNESLQIIKYRRRKK